MMGQFGRKILIPLFILLTIMLSLIGNFVYIGPVSRLVQFDTSLWYSKSSESYRVAVPRPFDVSMKQFSPFDYELEDHNGLKGSQEMKSALSASLEELSRCPRVPNKYTNHIRLPNILYNITMTSESSSLGLEDRKFWNPTIISLPSWARNQYIIISMVHLVAVGYRQNVLCEANVCYGSGNFSNFNDRACGRYDGRLRTGGMVCSSPPIILDVPSTQAKGCEGRFAALADIPGFHDGRLFYSGRGEPFLMFASQSRYACVGLWIVDLRALHPPLHHILDSSPHRLGPGPLISFNSVTELTRNPPETRRPYEKNWMIFSPSRGSSYLHYDLDPHRRTFAKLIGGGFTTSNLTNPLEPSCLQDLTPEEVSANPALANGTWHQSSPALKLVLCNRTDSTCRQSTSESVFFAVIHRKHENQYQLPLRYERYAAVWSASAPFDMLAVSRYPVLMANETTAGWSARDTWDDVPSAVDEGRGHWAGWTYTTTIAYAWRREERAAEEKNSGFLDDDIILSIGVDDEGQVYGRLKVFELLQCLRLCPQSEDKL